MIKMSTYYIKIDFDELKPKVQEEFLKLFNQPKFKKHIMAKSDSAIIISVPLFSVLEYDIEDNRAYKKNLKFTLVEKSNNVKSKIKSVMTAIGTRSSEYDELVRKIRF